MWPLNIVFLIKSVLVCVCVGGGIDHIININIIDINKYDENHAPGCVCVDVCIRVYE